MNLEYIKNNKQYVGKAVMLVIFILIVLTAGKVFGFILTSYQMPLAIQSARNNFKQDDETVKKYIANHRNISDELKKSNLFVPPSTSTPKLPVCTAILGDSALIDGKYYKAGDEISGATIVAVEAFEITVSWQGEEKKLIPFTVSNLTKEQMNPPSKPKQEESQPEQMQQPIQVQITQSSERGQGQRGDRGSRGGRGDMSGDERQRMMERYQNMSESERRQFRDEQMRRFRNR